MNDITKGETTNRLKKRWKKIKEWEGWFLIYLVIGTVVVVGAIGWVIDFGDKKNYPYGDYELTYRVYYDANNIREYRVTHNRPIMIRSHEGSNEVYLHKKGTVISTNAPIEKVRYINKAK
jgi:hypothetical protein